MFRQTPTPPAAGTVRTILSESIHLNNKSVTFATAAEPTASESREFRAIAATELTVTIARVFVITEPIAAAIIVPTTDGIIARASDITATNRKKVEKVKRYDHELQTLVIRDFY